jgi:hypothetical protein
MTGEELFGAAVRIIGFATIVYGLYTVIWGLLYSMWPHYWNNAEGNKTEVVAGQYFFAGGIQIFIGVMLIAEARLIISWVY